MKKITKKIRYYFGRVLIRLYGFKKKSYASLNEDLIIDWLVNHKKIGIYIDIGANDPDRGSNTKMFYERGWHGINIEPDKKDFEKLQKIRTRDINLNCAIGTGEKKYYSGDQSIGNTLVETLAKERGLDNVQVLQLKPLKEVFEENNLTKVDFISIDVETFEPEVLKSNDWNKYTANVLCIEGWGYGKFLKKYGYKYVFWDGQNSYYKLNN